MENILELKDRSYLIIEDDQQLQEVYQELFTSYGIKSITFCDDAHKAQDKISDATVMKQIDFIILDLGLPDIHGSKLLEQIRANPDYDQIKILIASADESSLMIEDMFSLGADDFLTKPFTGNILRKRLESLLLNKLHFINKTEFLPLRSSTFRLDDKIPFDVFLLQYNKYRLLLQAQDIVQPTHLQLMDKFNIKKVYIEDRAEPLYQSYLDEVIDQLLASKSVEADDKAEFLSDFGQHVIKEVYRGPTEESMKALGKVSEKIHDFLHESPNQNFQGLLQTDKKNTHYQHALKVTSIVVFIVHSIVDIQNNPKSKSKSLIKPFDGIFNTGQGDENFRILTEAAMLHRIGYEDKDSDDNTHPSILGSNKIKELSFITPKVAELVLHHREYNDGSGGPSKLNRNQTSLLAKILSFANFLQEELFEQDLDSLQMRMIVKKNESKFMTQLIELFKKSFKL